MLENGNAAARQLVVFTLDALCYALDLRSVERVVRMVEVRPLPQAPRIVEGAINVQGEIVAVVDPRVRFGLGERATALSDELVIARARDRRIALHVERVVGVAAYPESDIVGADAIAMGAGSLAGVAKLPDGMLLIHDLDRFLSADEEQRLDQALGDD